MTEESPLQAPPKRRLRDLLKRQAPHVSVTPHASDLSEKRMVTAAERFHRLRVDDVMVPRADIVAVESSCKLKDLSDAFKAAGHSRLPVYKETLDEPTGMVHIKDLLPYLLLDAKGRTNKTYPDKKVLQYIKREVIFVPPSMLAQDLLRKMQGRRIHMAIVVDEYGGTDGIVTIEDLIETIVGDIDDEHDEVEPEVQIMTGTGGRSIWEADARIHINDFEKALGRDFATPDEEDGVDTLGGLIFTLAGRVPERGEIIKHASGLEFEVMDADTRRVKRLRISDAKRKPVTDVKQGKKTSGKAEAPGLESGKPSDAPTTSVPANPAPSGQ
jgi:CBS domain containing-hemolysin-like protein